MTSAISTETSGPPSTPDQSEHTTENAITSTSSETTTVTETPTSTSTQDSSTTNTPTMEPINSSPSPETITTTGYETLASSSPNPDLTSTTTSAEDSTTMPERPPCYVLFYIDASLEADALDVSMKEQEKAFVLEVSESLYAHPEFALQVALAAYGADNYGTPDLNTTYDRRTQLASALDAWSLLDPNSEDIKNATTGLKVIGTWEHYFYVVLMSASPESVIKTASNYQFYPWTIGVGLAALLLVAVLSANAKQFDDLMQCKVLFVADLSDRAPASEVPTIVSTINTLIHTSSASGVNASFAHWRYSRGGDIDGPIPTKFVYSFQDSDLNFGSPGGSLDIIYATNALSYSVPYDVVIVLFTGSDPSKFAAAGQNYVKKWSTVGVTVGADASPFAALSIPYLQPLAIFQAAIELCEVQPTPGTIEPSTWAPTMPTMVAESTTTEGYTEATGSPPSAASTEEWSTNTWAVSTSEPHTPF
ncbi:unnamed protein product, partial [Mesorhabditis spiculigera]